jgi:hypothetical protein
MVHSAAEHLRMAELRASGSGKPQESKSLVNGFEHSSASQRQFRRAGR